MTNSPLPSDATFDHLQGIAKDRVEYIRRVLGNLHAHGAQAREQITVRMGIAGKGIAPHYKFEVPVPFTLLSGAGEEIDRGFSQDTFVIYNGLNHRVMKAFDANAVRDEHWSSVAMSYDDVTKMLGRVRAEMRR